MERNNWSINWLAALTPDQAMIPDSTIFQAQTGKKEEKGSVEENFLEDGGMQQTFLEGWLDIIEETKNTPYERGNPHDSQSQINDQKTEERAALDEEWVAKQNAKEEKQQVTFQWMDMLTDADKM